tara:strand:- start:2705 stop:3268 length:564 start_codon:yes stop_codon:yes gene_type:complete
MIKQFFIISSAIIMITGFLLIWDSSPESFLEKKHINTDRNLIADSYMGQASTSIFGTDGQRNLLLVTPKIELFYKKGVALFEKPVLVAGSSKNSVRLIAKSALLVKETNKIFMTGNVQLKSTLENEISTLSTENLIYTFDSGQIENDAFFSLKSHNTKLTGVGITAKPLSGNYHFKKNIQAHYETFR